MKIVMGDCVIVGSSRGLGAALVAEVLKRTNCRIAGIARTPLENIKDNGQWIASGRYQHIQSDIASAECRGVLKSFAATLPPEPLCIIFNAAHIQKDVREDHTIDYDAFNSVNSVGINGLGNILYAFEDHLLRHGGMLVGISSFWGSIPPLFLPWIAYPASKAYLNMALRCLRITWRKNIEVVVVNLGNIEEAGKSSLPKWFVPTYTMAAKKIVHSLLKKDVPKIINYPCWHSVIYRYILRFVPEFIYSWIFGLYFRLESGRRNDSA